MTGALGQWLRTWDRAASSPEFGARAPARLVGDPVGDVLAAVAGGGRQPRGRVLVRLRPVRRGRHRDQRPFVALVVGVGLPLRRRPGQGAQVPGLGERDQMVDVQAAGSGEVAVVIRRIPAVATEPAARALLGCGDGLGLQHLGAGGAAVLVGVDPVLELGALIPGAVLIADGQSGQGVAHRQGDGPARGAPGMSVAGAAIAVAGTSRAARAAVRAKRTTESFRRSLVVLFVAAKSYDAPGKPQPLPALGDTRDGLQTHRAGVDAARARTTAAFLSSPAGYRPRPDGRLIAGRCCTRPAGGGDRRRASSGSGCRTSARPASNLNGRLSYRWSGQAVRSAVHSEQQAVATGPLMEGGSPGCAPARGRSRTRLHSTGWCIRSRLRIGIVRPQVRRARWRCRSTWQNW